MAVPGLSLIGFMDQNLAMNYLRNRCLPTAPQEDFATCWMKAQLALGPPLPGAGEPEILDIPSAHDAYLLGVQQNLRFATTVHGWASWSFKLIEVDKLLAFQFHVETDRCKSICENANPGSVDDLLRVCLPHGVEAIPFQINTSGQSVLFRGRSTNLRLMEAGFFGVDPRQLGVAGVQFGASSPLVQVARFNGKCYLRNGFHRAYGLRKGGARHIPCLFLEASDFAQIGARGEGATFDRNLLQSTNPPTCGHFALDRAFPVMLRTVTRVIQVTWSDHSILDED